MCTVRKNMFPFIPIPFYVLLGGWPLVGLGSNTSWSINDESFLNELLYGSTAFFNFFYMPDILNNTRNVVCVRSHEIFVSISVT